MSAEAPLLALLRELIEAEGPIGVDRFMALALGHPVHGYYMSRDPFGAQGDFVTAPEISQIFGELIGLWCAATWQAIGAPPTLRLVELGPGRGTLMADLLRAAGSAPPFLAALDIHLVETSPVLRERQAEKLAQAPRPVTWHGAPGTVPDGPAIFVGNEFLDALPVRHFMRTPRGWCERLVGLDAAGRLAFGLAPEAEPRITAEGPIGALLEVGVEAAAVTGQIATRVSAQGGAALLIDYGYLGPAAGETLQAMRGHAFIDVLEAPGEADITAHVDFAAIRRAAAGAGVRTYGPVTQGAFLRQLGIGARAAQLVRRNPERAGEIEAALHRLASPGRPEALGMGELFKVLGLAAPGSPALPGFESEPQP